MARYNSERATVDGAEVVRLFDTETKARISVVPSVGNIATELSIAGENYLWAPHQSPAALKKNASLAGVPFLAPWANRLDQDVYWANGKQYTLNRHLGNIRDDPNHKPIHGFLLFEPWEVSKVEANEESASVTSRLDFASQPRWMAQFPFAHRLEMTYRLQNGRLSVVTSVHNLCAEPIPLAIGFHPYFTLPNVPKKEWTAHLAARKHMTLSEALIPTGESTAVQQTDVALADRPLDDVFSDLIRRGDGYAVFAVKGGSKSLHAGYGPKYPVAVVYSPVGREFICFEPMTGLTNAFNLAHAGLYKELQSVPPGGTWTEEFWIEPKAS